VTVGATWMLNRFATSLRLPTSDETFMKLGALGFANVITETEGSRS